MQEIEIKFKIDNRDDLIKRLSDLGCTFDKEMRQKDIIFVKDLNHVESKEGSIFVRIREQNDKKILTLKKQSKVVMQNKEIEFEISDSVKARDFIETLGLREWVTVEKIRLETSYKQYNFCIDQVKRLGDFVEIEILSEEENKTEEFEKEILSLAQSLNIDTNQRINNFYDNMIHELNEKEKNNA